MMLRKTSLPSSFRHDALAAQNSLHPNNTGAPIAGMAFPTLSDDNIALPAPFH
jgi:hypothetical protein